MHSIKIKLMFLYLTLVFIVMIVVGTYILSALREDELDKIEMEIKNYAEYIDGQVIGKTKSPENFQRVIEDILYSTKNNMQCSILNSRGVTIASTIISHQVYDNATIVKSIFGKERFAYSKEKVGDKTKIWYTYTHQSKFLPNGYIIFVQADLKYFLEIMSKMTFTLMFSLILSLCLAGGIGFLFARTLTEPIYSLSNNAKKIADGDLNLKIDIRSKDEIGELTKSFNYMTERLSQTMKQLTAQKNKLEIILQSMNDGIIYFGYRGNIIHYNYAAKNFLGKDINLDEINFDILMERLGLEIQLDFYRNNLVDFDEKATYIGDKYLSISFTTYKIENSLEGILVVIQDITKHKKLDDMRKEFVANVSHEIRTPLTTIKAYTETLLCGAVDDKNLATEFLTVINNEADRMSLLTKDLLELSRFDNGQMKFEFCKANLCRIINKSIEQNIVLAEGKKQRIIFRQRGEEFNIQADANRINQVFSNIISNAIKYSPENSKVEIHIEETSKYVRVYVKDNGCGIPKEDLHNIFERFYRVDKARSRKMGGTGLGLSIAKNIVEAHGGKIIANSELNVGTTMIIKLRK